MLCLILSDQSLSSLPACAVTDIQLAPERHAECCHFWRVWHLWHRGCGFLDMSPDCLLAS
jgi:hypothetical protein